MTKPHRIGVVARMYTDNTLNFITDGLRNVFYKGEKASNYESSSSLAFEWEVKLLLSWPPRKKKFFKLLETTM